MMSSLSFIIPSFNRFEILKENINYIDSLELPKDFDVEFIVAANTNQDKYSFISNESRFKIYFFDEYLPIGENIFRTYKLASKEYVYLLGDDDLIPPYFFFMAEHYLKKNYLCIHFNVFKGHGNSLNSLKKNKI